MHTARPAAQPAGSSAAPPPAVAQPASSSPASLPSSPSGGASRLVEIRLALSGPAAHALSEPRVRSLIEIEAESFAVLAPGAAGPLGDHVAYVWVDEPTAAKVVVEVRVGDRGVERRDLAVRGLAGDVAARLVAMAVSEMVRAGMAPRPAPAPPPAGPRRPTPDELERGYRRAPALLFTATGSFVGLPAASGLLAGPGLALGFRNFGATETFTARWLTGSTRGSALRWLELGLGADYTFWLGRSWRLGLGGGAAFSSVHLADAEAVEGREKERDTWSARANGLVSLEAKLVPSIWLALSAEPGAVLRPVRFTDVGGNAASVVGAWLGAGLALHFERVHQPAAP